MKKAKLIARTDTEGNLIVENLVQWAERYNETHRLIPAKGRK